MDSRISVFCPSCARPLLRGPWSAGGCTDDNRRGGCHRLVPVGFVVDPVLQKRGPSGTGGSGSGFNQPSSRSTIIAWVKSLNPESANLFASIYPKQGAYFQKGLNKTFNQFMTSSSNPNILKSIKFILYQEKYSIRGLARYCVHMTAT